MYDHSSLDSLLDPDLAADDLARHSSGGVSLTNLSHDSGLTTSDSQLYAFENEAGDNASFSSDDFCIETITNNDATVHAIVNKKFLSRYQNSYLVTDTADPTGATGGAGRKKGNSRTHKHRDRMHRRIHRNSDHGPPSSKESNENIKSRVQFIAISFLGLTVFKLCSIRFTQLTIS